MKLTPNLIGNAPNIISPEGKLVLVLRNLGILYIENLEHCADVYSIIDLTNNEIKEFSGIPTDGTIDTILIANNNISSIGEIQSDMGNDETTSSGATQQEAPSEPLTKTRSSLMSLLLINNNISAFSELSKLRQFDNLETLLMIGNPICNQHHYRHFLIWLLPKLRIIDGEKVKLADKSDALELFGALWAQRTPAVDALLNQQTIATAVPKETRLMTNAIKKLSEEEKEQLVKDLQKALTMEEIERLSGAMKNGYVK